MKTCKNCGKKVSEQNTSGLCKDCFFKEHPNLEDKNRTKQKWIQKKEIKEKTAEEIVNSAGKKIEINPSLNKKPYEIYQEMKRDKEVSSIQISVAMKESRELVQFLIKEKINSSKLNQEDLEILLKSAEVLSLQKRILNEYLSWFGGAK